MRRTYPTDVSDAEWACLKGYLPTPKPRGRPRVHDPREILNAVFYVLRSGCAWRLLPHDFPPWKTVFHYFRLWRLTGIWQKMHAALRERVRVRLKEDGFFGTQRFIDEFKGGSGQVGYIPHLKKMIAYVNRDIERMHVVTVRANETISKGGPRNGEEEDKNGGMGWTVFHWWEATHFRDRVVVQTFRGPTGDSSLAARNDVERQAYESRSVGIAQDRDLFGVVDMEETAQTWENAFTSTRRQALVNQVLNRPMMAIDSDPRGLIVDGQILPDSLDSRTLLFEVLTSREFRNRVQKSWLALTERSDDRLVQYAYQRLFNRDTTYDESQVIQHIASTFGYAASIAALLHSEEYEERYGQGFPTACAGQQPLISALNQADEEEES